jgi:hypothetical protein
MFGFFGKKSLDAKAKGKIFETAAAEAKRANGATPSLRELLSTVSGESQDSAVVTDLVKEFGTLGLKDVKSAEPTSWWDGAENAGRIKALETTAVWLNS